MAILSRIAKRVHLHDVAHFPKGVSSTLTIKYDIFNTVSTTREIRYDIFNLVTTTKQLIYDMRQLATTTREIIYDMAGVVTETLEIIYTNWGGTGKGNLVDPLPSLSPEPKHIAPNIFTIPITASLTDVLIPEINITGRLKDKYNGKIEAFTDKFYKLNKTGTIQSRLVSPQDYIFDILGQLKSQSKTKGLEGKLNFKPILEFIRRNLLILEGRIQTFTFEDTNIPAVGDPINFDREPTFQNPSSFVGLVTYFPDTQDMIVVLNGKPYNYCNVPQRIFDAFSGADSPGAYYNRNIKGLLTCI